jgi:hypothetical protein
MSRSFEAFFGLFLPKAETSQSQKYYDKTKHKGWLNRRTPFLDRKWKSPNVTFYAFMGLHNCVILRAITVVYSRCQFHQHFMLAFVVQKCFFHQNVTREKLSEALSYKKRARKMLMKLTLDQCFSTKITPRTFFTTTLALELWHKSRSMWPVRF